ncbi:GNAT family N-acetyltransferase [Bartonella sp. LJL80]
MIRKFIETDIDEIMEIWLETNIQTHSFIPAAYWHNHYTAVAKALPEASVYVYEENNNIHAFIGVTGGCYIAGLFVKPEYQSVGLGHQLLNTVKERYNALELRVYARNQRAIEFYKRNDFNTVSIETDFAYNEEEYVMQWCAHL